MRKKNANTKYGSGCIDSGTAALRADPSGETVRNRTGHRHRAAHGREIES